MQDGCEALADEADRALKTVNDVGLDVGVSEVLEVRMGHDTALAY